MALSEFDLLHPRAKKGTAHAGEFVDVLGRMLGLGEFDHERQLWVVPKENYPDVQELLNEIDMRPVSIPEGMRLATPEERSARKIPPGWTDAFVADTPDQKLQVLGFDRAGGAQRWYADWWDEQQAREKWQRIDAFISHMPTIDDRLGQDAGTDDTAATVMLMRKMGLRVGSDPKAKTFAATTLQRRHVKVTGDTVRLKFTGKGNKENDLELEDRELARVLKRRLRGKAGDERIFDTSAGRTDRYVDEIAPGFKNHDFRTHLATTEAMALIKTFDPPTTAKEAQKLRNQVGDYVSSLLGNTRKEALESYISPAVFGDWEDLP